MSVCIDCSLAVCGEYIEAASFLQVFLRNIFTHHCIMKQIVYEKVTKFKRGMLFVVSIVNYFNSRELNHEIFKTFLEESGTK